MHWLEMQIYVAAIAQSLPDCMAVHGVLIVICLAGEHFVVLNSAGLPALLVDLESLAELVSIGTLIVFYMVSAAVLWQRHYNPEQSRLGLALRLVGISIFALGASSHILLVV